MIVDSKFLLRLDPSRVFIPAVFALVEEKGPRELLSIITDPQVKFADRQWLFLKIATPRAKQTYFELGNKVLNDQYDEFYKANPGALYPEYAKYSLDRADERVQKYTTFMASLLPQDEVK